MGEALCRMFTVSYMCMIFKMKPIIFFTGARCSFVFFYIITEMMNRSFVYFVLTVDRQHVYKCAWMVL